MAASVELCTAADVQAYLGTDKLADLELIGDLIARASEAIESYCRRQFGEVERTEYQDGGSGVIILDCRPVIEVSAVYDDPAREWPESSLVPASSYVVSGHAGIVTADTAFSTGTHSVKVVYTSGYTTVPTDVAQACVIVVAGWFRSGRRARTGTVTNMPGTGPLGGLPAAAAGLLQPYRETG